MSYKGTIRKNTWFLTISNHKKNIYVSKGDIDAVLDDLKVRIPTFEINSCGYETGGKYRQLHWHGIVQVKQWFRYKNNNSILGFRLHWEQLDIMEDICRVYEYIHKEDRNKYIQDQILQTNYYHHNYGFTAGTNVAQAT